MALAPTGLFPALLMASVNAAADIDVAGGWSNCNCRRIRSKSSGAVRSRDPAPAAAPATALCHCGYVLVLVGIIVVSFVSCFGAAAFLFPFDVFRNNPIFLLLPCMLWCAPSPLCCLRLSFLVSPATGEEPAPALPPPPRIDRFLRSAGQLSTTAAGDVATSPGDVATNDADKCVTAWFDCWSMEYNATRS